MSILAPIAAATGIFLGMGSVPQAIKIFQQKSARDIAPSSYWITEIGSIVWVLYGLELHNWAVVIPNVLGFFTSTVILIGYFLYGRKNNEEV
jgi:MtN3 and saliva related transmembrane protein